MEPPEKPKAPPTRTPEHRKARERAMRKIAELARNSPPVHKQPLPKPPIVN